MVMGELGPMLDDPDVYALDILNSVLNGFGGRLFDQARPQRATPTRNMYQ